ncbi:MULTISPECIES: lactoylglutathione lyase [Larsenimonas]|uniref:lactoylglutathione lyase n=1 Tax=Larsenimonas suaedae TaxID=1851019 RepID=A0ABU1GW85_9GAMM|nr:MULTISPECIES: lactoylglutathione lyase [Larsenimonas]MCM2973421.1 lactoylglutathione lyase [Larsenimonas suaedae]MCM5705182.1 lactoylglutathione lyase [Larsenimonas salina]MDR5896314.1 lactoylglutathione lyase [Larsenimonas suaedae]
MTKPEQSPGVCDRAPEQTQGFRLNHTMVRVKDPQASLAFYSTVFGMRLLRALEFPEMQFTLYFLGHVDDETQLPEDDGERTVWTFSRTGLLELTYNWGSEKDPEVSYHNGNDAPQGFGHLCMSVPDLDLAVAWFDENDVEFVKRPDDGKMKDVAFVKDPDGYWIEVIEPARLGGLAKG